MATRQLSDNNPDGTVLGQSASDPIGFHGTAPSAQRSGAAQAAVSRANAAGVCATFSTTQSPAAVAQGTTAEQTLTVQSGTGGQMLGATTDVVVVNKPTQQAGLGVGNARISSPNTLGITFSNIPAAGGNITPTASEVYKVLLLRGMSPISATLSPAAVPANTTAEQLFTITGGLPAGQLVIVNKPTAQAGLDIVGCRITSTGQLGITFGNFTASPITPTASEVYAVLPLAGLDAINTDMFVGMNVGTVGAIGVGVVATGGSTTVTGVLATDMVTAVYKPTNGAAATNAASVAGAIASADALTPYFNGIGTGATPTASEVYGFRLSRINPAAPLKLYSQSLAPTSVAAATTAEQTFTVTGAVVGSVVHVNKPSFQPGLGIAGVRVSAADTIAITYVNATATAIVPATETYLIGNFQVKAPGAGNVVYQAVSTMVRSALDLLNEIRAALTAKGFVAGA